MADAASAPLRHTPLDALHRALGGKMVPFAGYDMPVQYPAGILAEHLHTRSSAGLFDVSHMGQVRLEGPDVVAALETLVPGDVQALALNRTRYTLFTNDKGGILDDLMVTNGGDHLFMVVNAACKVEDIAHMRKHLEPKKIKVTELTDRALMAIQGPQAAAVMARLAPATASMKFMSFSKMPIAGIDCWLTRSGYTGEDGFEISVPNKEAEKFAKLLLDQPEVKPIGLGARDSLRLEAGLCLYGHDIDTTTTPIEADLNWTISKRRREQGGFPGAAIIQKQLKDGVTRKRVGILPEGRAPARDRTPVTDASGKKIGEITSGGFGPTQGGPVAMGYVAISSATPGTAINLVVRDVPRPAKIVAMPLVPHRYHRG
jgi:aminomethyltransferase